MNQRLVDRKLDEIVISSDSNTPRQERRVVVKPKIKGNNRDNSPLKRSSYYNRNFLEKLMQKKDEE